MSTIPTRCDHRCTEGVRSPTWVTGWYNSLHMAFTRAITPDMPTITHMMILIDNVRGQGEHLGLRPSPSCYAY